MIIGTMIMLLKAIIMVNVIITTVIFNSTKK